MVDQFIVPAPGIFEIDEETYHADPVPEGSLSSTGARAILPPGTPAQFRYEQTHTRHKRAWDLGSAAHQIVLGTGPEIVVIDADSYRTKDAQEQRDAAYADGQIPLLTGEYEDVLAMVTQIRRHPVAGPLFADETGAAEQSLFWVDEATGVWCRARLDWMKPAPAGGRLIVADLKTTMAADEESISKTIGRYSYHQQAAWYLSGVRALDPFADPAFVLVFVEKTPPHLVHVVQIPFVDLQTGEAKNRRARQIYAECKATDTWPGYPTDITTVSLPVWQSRTEEEEYLSYE